MFINYHYYNMKPLRTVVTTTFMIASSALRGRRYTMCMSFTMQQGLITNSNRYCHHYSNNSSCPSSLRQRHSINIINEQLRFICKVNRYQQQQCKYILQSRSLHLTSSSYYSSKSTDIDDMTSSSTMKHQLYLQQIQELELERQTLLGSDTMIHDSNNNSSNSTNSTTNISSSSSQGTLPIVDSLHNNSNNDTANTQSDFISYNNRKEDYVNNIPPVVSEIEAESSMSSSSNNDDNNNDIDDIDDNTIHSERELVYRFTIEEKNAWMNSNSRIVNNNNEETKRKHESLLRDIALARQQQDKLQLQQQLKQEYDDAHPPLPTTIDSSSTDAIAATNSTIFTTSSSQSSSVQSFSHLTSDEKHIHMVNVGSKNITHRTATAQSMVIFPPEVLQAFSNQTNTIQQQQEKPANEWIGPKGPIFATAITAGIMGVKQTSTLIPLCHPLPIEHIQINIIWYNTNTIQITCTCSVTHKTGVEMEALMGCSITALTIYDMVKAISHNVQITNTQLLYKDGGKRFIDQRSKE